MGIKLGITESAITRTDRNKTPIVERTKTAANRSPDTCLETKTADILARSRVFPVNRSHRPSPIRSLANSRILLWNARSSAVPMDFIRTATRRRVKSSLIQWRRRRPFADEAAVTAA